MGVVYGAEPETAIKILNARRAAMQPDLVRRFEIEAEAASRLESRHIAKVFASGTTEDGHLFIAMELLRGEPLDAILEGARRLPPATAAVIAYQVALALEEAHSARIVHRDLKPANIFVEPAPDGGKHIRVLDFGVARINSESVARSQTGRITGTPAYMSPEQLRGESDIDGRSDIYSLGVVLYQVVAGFNPFRSPDGLLQTLRRHVELVPPPISDIPPRLNGLIQLCLAKDRTSRPNGMAEVRRLLLSTGLLGSGSDTDTIPQLLPPLFDGTNLGVTRPPSTEGCGDDDERQALTCVHESTSSVRGRAMRGTPAVVGGVLVLSAAALLIPSLEERRRPTGRSDTRAMAAIAPLNSTMSPRQEKYERAPDRAFTGASVDGVGLEKAEDQLSSVVDRSARQPAGRDPDEPPPPSSGERLRTGHAIQGLLMRMSELVLFDMWRRGRALLQQARRIATQSRSREVPPRSGPKTRASGPSRTPNTHRPIESERGQPAVARDPKLERREGQPSRQTAFDRLIALAMKRTKSHPERAIQLLAEAARRRPDSHLPYQRLCVLHQSRESFRLAIINCKKWRELEPNASYRDAIERNIEQLQKLVDK